MSSSALYFGQVMHKRLQPFEHRFTYRVFSLLLDLDALAALDRSLRLFGHNRWAPVSFHDRDHGARDGSPLRPWVQAAADRAGLGPLGRIRVLCFPRLWGYVFNPLSVYFCDHPDGRPAAILYEVKNTFGDQHGYLMPLGSGDDQPVIAHARDKAFYVSPFIDMRARYEFRVRPPGESVALMIRETQDGVPLLLASLAGRAAALDDAGLWRALRTHPLMSLKVTAAIHWQALLLWRKGAKFHRRPPPPIEPVSVELPIPR